MPWLRFNSAFPHKTARTWRTYAEGEALNVPTHVAEAALAAGAARKIKTPRRGEQPTDQDPTPSEEGKLP